MHANANIDKEKQEFKKSINAKYSATSRLRRNLCEV